MLHAKIVQNDCKKVEKVLLKEIIPLSLKFLKKFINLLNKKAIPVKNFGIKGKFDTFSILEFKSHDMAQERVSRSPYFFHCKKLENTTGNAKQTGKK